MTKIDGRERARDRKMALLTQQGFTPADIARRYRLAYSKVVNALNRIQKLGVKVVWTNVGVIKVKKAKKIASLLESGLTLKEVLKRTSSSYYSIKEYLEIAEKHGAKVDWSKIETLTGKNKQYAERRKQIAELTQQGWSVKQIAEKFGISKQAVSQLLRKAAKEGHTVVLSKRVHCDNLPSVVAREKAVKTSTCLVCGKDFPKKGNTKTCGLDCKKIFLRRGGKWSKYEFRTFTCANCGNTFKRSNYIDSIASIKAKPGSNKYCSRKCYLEKYSKQVVKVYRGASWPKPKV